MTDEKRFAPRVDGQLRHNILRMPETVYDATGIVINGRCIKSFVFTTDLAIIRNCDADAVFAVYPFTPQQAISDALIKASYIPVFCGVGGGTTHGLRTVGLAKDVECQGAMGVVLNAPITNLNLRAVALAVDIPVIITVTKEDADIAGRLQNGASILNIACAAQTPQVVRKIREGFPEDVLQPGKAPGKYQLDLWKANQSILLRAGIQPEHMAVTNVCTCHNPEYLFSHRASHGQRGNLAAFLMLKESWVPECLTGIKKI